MPRGRERIALGTKGEAILAKAIEQGLTAEQLVARLKAVGVTMSVRTAGFRLSEKRGRQRTPRVDRKSSSKTAKGSPPAKRPTSVDLENLDKADPMTLEQWLKWAERAAKQAADDGNLPMVGAMGRLAVQISEARRKALPPPEENPEDDPDLRALAAETTTKLHRMVDQVLGAKP